MLKKQQKKRIDMEYLKKIWLLPCVMVIFAGSLFSQPTLTMEDAVKTALENNYGIKLIKVDQVEARLNNTLGNAGFLPDVSMNLGRNYNVNNTRQQFFNGDIREGDNVQSNTLNANVQLNWTVFDGMRMFVRKDMLRKQEEISALQWRIQVERLVADVMDAYLMLQQMNARIDVLQQAVDFSEARRKLTVSKEEIGVASRLDVIQTSVDINSDSTALVRQVWEMENAKIALNTLLGRQANTPFEIEASAPEIKNLTLDKLWSETLESNPEIELLNQQIQFAQLRIKESKAGYLPEVSLSGGYSFFRSAAEIGILRFNQNAGYNYGLTGRWTLFNGMNNRRQIQLAKLDMERQQLNKDQNLLFLQNQLSQIFNQYQMHLALEKMEYNNVDVARKNLEISMEKLNIGTITGFELREAQNNLIDAEFRLINSQFMTRMTETELQRISGQLKPKAGWQ
jgi:outer membrane protein